MIVTNKLTVQYKENRGIFDVSLSIPDEQIHALVGPSGCGKTTLLHAISQLVTIDKGYVKTTIENKQATVGVIQQEHALFPWLTVFENITIGLTESHKEKEKRCVDILEKVKMSDYLHSYPYQLSGGQKQRVSIARTLIMKPDILVMDEPTASLDAIMKESLQDLLLDLHMSNKRTTLFVTHSIEEALFLAKKVYIMDQGTIVHVYTNPLTRCSTLREQATFYEQVTILRKLQKQEGSL